MQKRLESEHADIDIGNQVADINLEMLPNRLFLPSIHINVTGYNCKKKMFLKLQKPLSKIHRILKKTHPCFGNFLSTNNVKTCN